MQTLSVIFARTLVQAAGHSLAETGQLVANGETVLDVDVRGGRVSVDGHYAILDWIAANVPDRAALAIRHAQALDIDHMGTLGLACKAAPDLRGSLNRLVRYFNILSDNLRYHMGPHDGGTLLWQEFHGATGRGAVITPEAGLAAAVHIMRQITSDHAEPLRVLFRHTPPPDARRFKAFFRCEVEFSAHTDGILVSDETLATPNKIGDPALSQFLTRHLEAERAAIAPPETLAERVLNQISAKLSDGVPKAGDLALQLGMSERTFHRKLADDGESYKTLCDRTRDTLARNLLRNSQHSLAEIAFITGFSEQSAFTRAFKRWQGQTPAEFRGASQTRA